MFAPVFTPEFVHGGFWVKRRQVWQDFVFTCPALQSSQEQPDEKTEQSYFTGGATNIQRNQIGVSMVNVSIKGPLQLQE